MILFTKFSIKKHKILLFFIVISNVLVSASSIENEGIKCIDRERETLLKFKDELIDNYGRLSIWGTAQQKKDCCKWTGIKCDNGTNHVVSLDLQGIFATPLRGYISPFLLELSDISYLDLSFNDFNTTIPKFIGSFKNFQHLSLSYSNFTGSIPPHLGNLSMLEYLDLSNNGLYGSIPPLSRFFFLNTLNLRENILNGSFADIKLRLPYLTSLDVAKNRLTGRLPDLSSCSSLETLSLSENKFNGTLPETIGHLSKLQELDLHSNELEGVVSETHLFNLSVLGLLDLSFNSNLTIRISSDWIPPFQLSTLNLANCTIGPSFPKWLQNQTKIEYLDISCSKIDDPVPGWFWDNSHSLTILNMSFNHIYGVIPYVSRSIYSLDLSSNEFNGSLPLKFNGSLPRMFPPTMYDSYHLSRNKFSGEINEFCNDTYELLVLDLSDNRLSGELTEECFMNLKFSVYLNLGNNNLSGEIPNPNSSFCRLNSLHLRNNTFRGHFPVSIRDCNDLDAIDLGNNYFSGEIPTWIGESYSQLKFKIQRVYWYPSFKFVLSSKH